MTTLAQAALVLLLQSTILLLLGLLALHLTRRLGSAVRTLIGRAALVSVALLALLLPLLLPLTGHIQPVVQVRLPKPTPLQAVTLPEREGKETGASGSDAAMKAAMEEAARAGADASGPAEPTGAAVPEGAASSAPASPLPPMPTTPRPLLWGGPLRSNLLRSKEVGSLWAAVSAALLLWLAACQGHLTRLRRTAQPVTSGQALALLVSLTPKPPQLLSHPAVHSPFLAGLRRPVLFLPLAFETQFEADALRAVFVHELAHEARRDNFWTLAARLLTALLWPQPLLWLLVRKLEQISEDACDEAVLAHHCPPRAYADCLLSLATRPPLAPAQRSLSAGVAPFRSSVGRRIHRILSAKGDRPMPAVTPRLRLSIAAVTLAAALSGAFLVSSAPAQVNSPAVSPTASPVQTQNGDTRTARQTEQAKLKADLAAHKIELAEAIMDYDLTHQQLTRAVHDALPQAASETQEEAFNLEEHIGWSLSGLKLWKTSKAASQLKNHPQSVAKFEHLEEEAQLRLDRDTLKERLIFPKTAQLTRQLSDIHILAEHLYEQGIKLFEARVEAEALASMLQRRSSPDENSAPEAPPAKIISKPDIPMSREKITLTLDSKGAYFLDGVRVSENQIEPRLANIARQNPNIIAYVKADKNQPYRRVVKLIDTIKQAGIQKIAIAQVTSSSTQPSTQLTGLEPF